MKTAAIVTVGTELTAGLRLDTNTAEIARAIAQTGHEVIEAVSVADDVNVLSATLERLCASYDLVITTGGLGPTHDDITREAAARALNLSLERDPRLEELLRPAVAVHSDPRAAEQMLVQADVFAGARIIDPTSGTAPGLVIPTVAGRLVLLPGPPAEMRPMLSAVIEDMPSETAVPHEIGVVGLSESDAQVATQGALAGFEGVGFTVLAKPGDVRLLLLDAGCGAEVLAEAAKAVSAALSDHVYSTNGRSLAHAVVFSAIERSLTLSVAESCTGGMVTSALTEIPGSSKAVLGAVVAYDNAVKRDVLGVGEDVLAEYGAVSQQVAFLMAQGVRARLGSDIAVSVTGIAGPSGGTAEKPVGLVWFGVATPRESFTLKKMFRATSRESIRMRATSTALDLLRRAVRDL